MRAGPTVTRPPPRGGSPPVSLSATFDATLLNEKACSAEVTPTEQALYYLSLGQSLQRSTTDEQPALLISWIFWTWTFWTRCHGSRGLR